MEQKETNEKNCQSSCRQFFLTVYLITFFNICKNLQGNIKKVFKEILFKLFTFVNYKKSICTYYIKLFEFHDLVLDSLA